MSAALPGPTYIHYLQRDFLPRQAKGPANDLFCGLRSLADLRLLHVQGLTRFWQANDLKAEMLRQLVVDFYSGLNGEAIPLAFLIMGTLDRISVFVGCTRDNESWPVSRNSLDGDLRTLSGNLQSALPGISLRICSQADLALVQDVLRSANGCSLLTGTPTAKVGAEQSGAEQIDRLVRGMYGRRWGLLVLAKPYLRSAIDQLQTQAFGEMTSIANHQQATARTPVVDAYADLLKTYAERLALGKAAGLWRVTAYIFGADRQSFVQARATTQAVFGGEKSLPDPLRLIDCSGYASQMANLSHAILACQHTSPGRVVYSYEYASNLTSAELATLAHFPLQEFPGYAVHNYARFDVSPPSALVGRRMLALGEILDNGQPTGNQYSLDLERLAEHALIGGVTGSGKTNSAMHLLQQAWQAYIPFLVVESAKTEYRALVQRGDASLRVFTLGDERLSPFRLNPFQVLPGVAVQTHIDHLKAVFNASFAMYGPMPHVLEQCIYAIYADRGWDMATGANRRGAHPSAFPTLTDLYHKIDEVVEALGYGDRITPELKAALKVRVNSLRIGSKGLMMDTHLSLPIEQLLQAPTILELQSIGDDDEKAFIIGVLWIFLYEYRRTRSHEGGRLQHLTLIEEAHRLLAAAPAPVNNEVANIRGKAVETFCNMLSEIRAYGEGVIIADQSPTRLAPDAIKNTGLKLMHRTVAVEDREMMGGSMNLDAAQLQHVSALAKGVAAVFAEGDDQPYLVRIARSLNLNAPLPQRADAIGLLADRKSPAVLPEMESIRILSSDADDDLRIVVHDPSMPHVEGSRIEPPSLFPDSIVIIDDVAPAIQPIIVVSEEEFGGQPVDADATLSASDRQIQARMAHFRQSTPEIAAVYQAPLTACPICRGACAHRAIAAATAEDKGLQQAFVRWLLAVLLLPDEATAELANMETVARRATPHGILTLGLFRFILRFLAAGCCLRLGSSYGWSHAATEDVQEMIIQAADALVAIRQDPVAGNALALQSPVFRSLQDTYLALCRRAYDPFPQCAAICPDNICRFRFFVDQRLADKRLDAEYRQAIANLADNQPLSRTRSLREFEGLVTTTARQLFSVAAPQSLQTQAGACLLIQKAYALTSGDSALDRHAGDLAVDVITDMQRRS